MSNYFFALFDLKPCSIRTVLTLWTLKDWILSENDIEWTRRDPYHWFVNDAIVDLNVKNLSELDFDVDGLFGNQLDHQNGVDLSPKSRKRAWSGRIIYNKPVKCNHLKIVEYWLKTRIKRKSRKRMRDNGERVSALCFRHLSTARMITTFWCVGYLFQDAKMGGFHQKLPKIIFWIFKWTQMGQLCPKSRQYPDIRFHDVEKVT